jgi:hypothetical protein
MTQQWLALFFFCSIVLFFVCVVYQLINKTTIGDSPSIFIQKIEIKERPTRGQCRSM